MLAGVLVLGAAVLICAEACGLDVVGGLEAVDDASADGAAQPMEDGSVGPHGDAAASDAEASDAEAGPITCLPSPAGLVSWWTGDGVLTDHVGANDGISGSQKSATPVTFDAGYVGQAFALDGGSYVQVPNAPSLQLTSSITMEARVHSPSFGGRIIDKITAGGADGYMLDTFQSKLRIIIGTAVVSSPTTLPLNTWVHVAGTWDGTTARVYVNGAEVASVPAASLPNNTLALRIGSDNTGATRFAGSVDEVAIYNRALSAAEIAAIVARGPAGRCK